MSEAMEARGHGRHSCGAGGDARESFGALDCSSEFGLRLTGAAVLHIAHWLGDHAVSPLACRVAAGGVREIVQLPGEPAPLQGIERRTIEHTSHMIVEHTPHAMPCT